MIDLPYKKVVYNDEKEMFNVSFRMSKAMFDKVRSLDMVEDIGLAILAGIEQELKFHKPDLDHPGMPPVDVKE